jgi:hypothetical protein
VKRSQWWGRTALAIGLYVAAYAVTAKLRWDPEPVRLALVIGLSLALIELMTGALDATWSSWKVDSIVPAGQPGRDAHFSTYLRILEGHLTAKTPDPALRDRLAMLADRRLMQHHGLTRDDPRAAALLGPELLHDLDAAPRRLSLSEVERHLTRIEEL